eukprot:5749927-Amphidinium_carterae.1
MIDAELEIRWSSRHQSNEGDHLHQWIEGGHNHRDATPHLGVATGEGAHLDQEIGDHDRTIGPRAQGGHQD